MRSRLAVLIAFLLLISGLASAQVWQPRGGGGEQARVCFYEHAQFAGRSFCLYPGQSVGTMPSGLDRAVSSVRVFGNVTATAFRERNFSSDRWNVNTDVRDLQYVAGWNDRIRSVRVDLRDDRRDRDHDGDHDRDNDRDRGRNDWRNMRSGVCFFQHANFAGESFCLRPGEEAATMPAGFDKQISSVKLFGDAVVTAYRDRNFEGDRWIIQREIRDAQYVDAGRWNDKVRSVRVDAFDDDYNNGRRSWRGAAGACFYQNANYQGERFCLRSGEQATSLPPGLDGQVSAIRLFGDAVVTVFRDHDFRGDKQTFDRTVRDFQFVDSGRWNDRIRSVRVDDARSGGY